MIGDLINQDQMDEHVIIANVMDYIGLETEEDSHIVVDRDLFTPLAVEEKILKYSKDDYVSINYDREMFYNPVRNYRTAMFSFLHMLKKLEMSDQFYSPQYEIEPSKEDKRMDRLIVFDKDYNMAYVTEYYYKTNYIFIEMIYQLAGDDTKFTEIDEPY